jgi:hypothetical protein
MDNVQKHNNCTKIPSSQTFRVFILSFDFNVTLFRYKILSSTWNVPEHVAALMRLSNFGSEISK